MIKIDLLAEKPKNVLKYFMWLCESLGDIDTQLVYNEAVMGVRYLRGDKTARARMWLSRELEQRWYESLENNKPDWTVYDTDYYLGELWACWMIYSRRYLLAIQSSKSLPDTDGVLSDIGNVYKVVDLGCGFGFTTAALKGLFPDADVVGTNLDKTKQIRLARRISQVYDFEVVNTIDEIAASTDLVFASEYFEHIPAPVQHLRDVVNVLSPRYLLIANTFTSRSIGHFDYYDIDGQKIDGRTTSRIFNNELRQMGYSKIKTKLWNNRPMYWKLIQN